MVTTKIFQHRNTTSYIFGLESPEQDPTTTFQMAEVASVIIPAVQTDGDVDQSWGEDVVEVILSAETDAGGTVMYMVRFGDGGEYPVSERSSQSEIPVN